MNNTCKCRHDHWARSASEHDDARTKKGWRDADAFGDHAEAEKGQFPILALPLLHKHLQTHLRFQLGAVGVEWVGVALRR